MRVLFVDDDREILDSYRRVFMGRFEMKFATNGQEALEVLASGPAVDAVVADYLMPGLDGAKLLAKIGQSYPETFRVLLTGYMEKEESLRAGQGGAIHRILSKPCLPHELALVLEKSLEPEA